MNQILDFDTAGNSSNNGKNNKAPKTPKNKNYGGGSDKVVRVFALLLIILAVALIASGAMSILKNKKDSEKNKTVEKPKIEASISAEEDEENSKVVLTIKNEIAIDKVVYNWDQDTEMVISGEDRTEIEKSIDLPSGTHDLHIKVTDKNNNQTMNTFHFESESGVDIKSPEITLETTSDGKLLITATDDTELAFITYMWNEGEQIQVKPEEDSPKKIELTLDIPMGENTITVIAVDNSETSNTKHETGTYIGATKPEINYAFPNGDTSVLEIITYNESGIKRIYYTLNGREYEYNAEENNYPSDLSFTQESDEGINEIHLTVTGSDGIESKFDANWEYYPNGAPSEEQQPENDTNTSNETEENDNQN